jgi:hemerythrin
MNSVEIRERVKELATACGIVTLTERQFVFNQLYMQFINLNNIQSQGKTYKDVYPKIVQHFIDFEIISKGYRENKFDSFLDEVNDYLMYHVRNSDKH